jgi:hypothetical protein
VQEAKFVFLEILKYKKGQKFFIKSFCSLKTWLSVRTLECAERTEQRRKMLKRNGGRENECAVAESQ